MSRAVRVHAVGGPEVLQWESMDLGDPGPGEVRVRHTAVGLNFIDVYFRTGLYPSALPFTPGMEGAGVVESVGSGVTELKVGDRVAYGSGPMGAYATARIMPASSLVRIAAEISDETAAAAMLKGLTAQYLLCQIGKLGPGDTILFHAAAGGVGLIACQWAKQLGATVIGTVGTDEKAKLAADHGCDHPIVYSREDFVDRVRAITGGAGVKVVYDSVGQDTFLRSMDCLAPLGTLVSFGQSSGPVAPLDIAMLGWKGSLFLTRPSLMTYTQPRSRLEAMAADLFAAIARGVRIPIGQRFPLADAAAAHRALQARATTGATVLIP